MRLETSAFPHNGAIPARYTCDGEEARPELHCYEVPDSAKSLALIAEDPDAPQPMPWIHWTLWGIPGTTIHIGEHGLPPEAVEGMTDGGAPGYHGPCPPRPQTPTFSAPRQQPDAASTRSNERTEVIPRPLGSDNVIGASGSVPKGSDSFGELRRYSSEPMTSHMVSSSRLASHPNESRTRDEGSGRLWSGVHRYFFRLYALDILPELGPQATAAELRRVMDGHIIEETHVMGTYERGPVIK